MLDMTGCTVTIDAMGCQKNIASQIKKQGGDYLLSLKENQSTFYKAVTDVFEKKITNTINSPGQDEQVSLSEEDDKNIFSKKIETIKKTHGRIAKRKCTVISAIHFPKFKLKWDGLESIIMIESTRTINNKTSLEKRYYISSHLPNAEILEPTIRKHWLVENQLHWCLDISFREDDCRVRKGNAAGNFAIVRHVALNALKSERYPNEKPIPFTVLINPVIEILDADTIDGWEGCLSVPGLRGLVPRYKKIQYSGYDPEGNSVSRIADGFHARVIQHECDHIDGILFPQRIKDMRFFGFEEELKDVIWPKG